MRSGPGGTSQTELYDLLEDAGERQDIAEDHPELVVRMTAEVHQWQRSVELSLSGADYPSDPSPLAPTGR